MLILERIEGSIAVIERDGECFEVSAESISANAVEGDVLTLQNGVYIPDSSATKKRREEITKKQNSLWG